MLLNSPAASLAQAFHLPLLYHRPFSPGCSPQCHRLSLAPPNQSHRFPFHLNFCKLTLDGMPGAALSALHVLMPLTLMTNEQDGCCFYCHFIDQQAEAQQHCLKSRNLEVAVPGLEPGNWTPESKFSTKYTPLLPNPCFSSQASKGRAKAGPRWAQGKSQSPPRDPYQP